MPGTVHLHRVIAVKPEKLFRAFTEAEAMAAWLPPYGYTARVEAMDVREGGSYRMAFTNFTTGKSESFGGDYVEVVPDARLVYTDSFDDPNLPGLMTTTIMLKAVSAGTDLSITQEGIPDVIPTEMCYLGWQDSLDKLTRLVTPEINQ
jgi:uncharacterized protein YndB with AHSA1/START domain